MALKQLDIHIPKEKKKKKRRTLISTLHHTRKINSKWITDLNVKFKTIKYIGEKAVKTMKRKVEIGRNTIKNGQNIWPDISPQNKTKHTQKANKYMKKPY